MKSGESQFKITSNLKNTTTNNEIEDLLKWSTQNLADNKNSMALELAQKAEINSKKSNKISAVLRSILLQVRSLYKLNKFDISLEKITEGEQILDRMEYKNTQRDKRVELIMLKGDAYAGLGELDKAISTYKLVQNMNNE